MPNASKIEERLYCAIGSSEQGKGLALQVADKMYPHCIEPAELTSLSLTLRMAMMKFDQAAKACFEAIMELTPDALGMPPREAGGKMPAETKWTPGPWYADPGFVGKKRALFVTTPGRDGFRPWSDSDAHLIAAAPDLYEALEGALQLLEIDGAKHNIWRRALAKARGEDAT